MVEGNGTAKALTYWACAALTVGSVACDFEEEIRAKIDSQLPEGLIVLRYTIVEGRVTGTFPPVCRPNGQDDAELTCSISVGGTLNGEPFEETYNVEIKAKCVPNADFDLRCDDPIVVQFPSDVFNLVGTYDDGEGCFGYVEIDSGLPTIPIGPGADMAAEPDHQLVMLRLPDGLPDGTYDLAVQFYLGYIRDIEIKVVVSAEVTCAGETYFPPVVPCVTDFADVAALTIPVSDALVPVSPPLDEVVACAPAPIECGECRGDLNGDGFRNVQDFSYFALAFGSESGDANYTSWADMGRDGVVDLGDFLVFADVYWEPCP